MSAIRIANELPVPVQARDRGGWGPGGQLPRIARSDWRNDPIVASTADGS